MRSLCMDVNCHKCEAQFLESLLKELCGAAGSQCPELPRLQEVRQAVSAGESQQWVPGE